MRLLCCCAPAYEHDDTIITETELTFAPPARLTVPMKSIPRFCLAVDGRNSGFRLRFHRQKTSAAVPKGSTLIVTPDTSLAAKVVPL